MKAPALMDAYGRPLDNIRISVTRECNYHCFFCHLEGDPAGAPRPAGSSPPLMTPYDYLVLARAASRLGILSFKLTGGEPLVRRDIVDVVKAIREGAGSPGTSISMTTNGYLLDIYATRLKDAGLSRVNVSIHSLNRDRYRRITGVDGLDRALRGVKEAIRAGLAVKVNMTVTRDNYDEVMSLIDLASREGFKVQLIELQPVNEGRLRFSEEHVTLESLEKRLKDLSVKTVIRKLHNRPIYVLANGVEVEVVKPYDNPIFCAGCSRVRVLADGKLTPCINYVGPGVDLLSRIRGVPFEDAVTRAEEALIEVNRLRRPFYMWRLGVEKSVEGHLASHNGSLRLPLPKVHQRLLGVLRAR